MIIAAQLARHPVAESEAELPRTTARETLSISHEVSLLLPVRVDICLPSLCRKLLVEGPMTPVVSMATGSNRYLSVRVEYLFLFRSSAAIAADPGVMAESTTAVLLNVSTQVASHVRHLP